MHALNFKYTESFVLLTYVCEVFFYVTYINSYICVKSPKVMLMLLDI